MSPQAPFRLSLVLVQHSPQGWLVARREGGVALVRLQICLATVARRLPPHDTTFLRRIRSKVATELRPLHRGAVSCCPPAVRRHINPTAAGAVGSIGQMACRRLPQCWQHNATGRCSG